MAAAAALCGPWLVGFAFVPLRPFFYLFVLFTASVAVQPCLGDITTGGVRYATGLVIGAVVQW